MTLADAPATLEASRAQTLLSPPNGALILSNGSIYKGQLFGSAAKHQEKFETLGEVVFQTGMVGYCESLTDPSYHRQILALTYPLVGNYGVPEDGAFESDRIWPAALVVGELSKEYSHWEAKRSLCDWMSQHNTPGLEGIDTRKLTKELRCYGTLVGKLARICEDSGKVLLDESDLVCIAKDLNRNEEFRNYPQKYNLVEEVSPKISRTITLNDFKFPRITLLDCGAKNNIERSLVSKGVCVHRVPWNYDIVSNVNSFDGLMLSNGPGDPLKCQHIIDQLKQLFNDDNFNKPIFGICLGHQLMGLAAGFKTYKMPFGNRGHNQPCRLVGSKRCLITSQNHGYALDTNPDNVDSDVNQKWKELFVNQNDKSNEGIAHRKKPFFSVQFHPEHNAGPRDSEFLFDIFIRSVICNIEGGPDHGEDGMSNGFNQVKAIFDHVNKNQSPKAEGIRKVLVLGSGGLSIGQAGEFDYSGSQAIKALKDENIFTILINPNIATVQTSPTLVDRVYLLPVTAHYVSEVIRRERPDGLMLMFGGQTALNCGIELEDSGILAEHDVKVLGPPITTIRNSEDRKLFCDMMAQIGVEVAPSCAINTVTEAIEAANNQLGYPILVRAAFALGGLGSGFANDERELRELVTKALAHSSQVLLDKSLKGWKELEYEVVRDIYDNCATICNMENVDPLGIHTGESIVVAPSQTLNDYEYNILRETAIKIVRHLGVIGECNVQYAVNPKTSKFYVIEVNPRLSRSSALASKATGYPLAYIAAKLALGKSLSELENAVTSSEDVKTTACFEPSLDYCVVKVPRWDLSKFAGVTHEIGSSMKSVGEVMAIGRCFEEAFQKALRMVTDSVGGFDPYPKITTHVDTVEALKMPTDKRIFVLAHAMEQNFTISQLYDLTAIDPWFLNKMKNIVDLKKQLRLFKVPELDMNSTQFGDILLRAKKLGFSDKQIGSLVGRTELMIRKARCDVHNMMPCIKQVDTVAAEWPARTNYLYLTYNGDEHDIALPDRGNRRFTTRTQSVSQAQPQSQSPSPSKTKSKLAERVSLANQLAQQQHNSQKQVLQQFQSVGDSTSMPPPVLSSGSPSKNTTGKMDQIASELLEAQILSEQVLVLGSGVYRIGSSVEFDCCAVGCVRELRRMGKKVIMLNYNPETVSTDFNECEKLYFDEISFETVMDIYNLEQPLGIVLSMGGQIPNNIAMQLHNQKASILGTSPESIDNAEDRFKFSRLLDSNNISQPRWKKLVNLADAFEFCKEVSYPCIVRPSYVLSGAAMNVAHSDSDLKKFLSQAIEVSQKHPVVISKFIEDAKEIDIDGVAQNGELICMAVSEHVENAGVHSGDATLVTPPQDLNAETLATIHQICSQIALALDVNGPFNIQLIAKDNQLKVIECNLRASRSFPFVSKTLNYDFIATATKVIMGQDVSPINVAFGQLQPTCNYTSRSFKNVKRVGVKVPQFSFSRLSGADIKLGVEMASTGEVACFGKDRYSAYLKALISTGFRLPERKIVLISIGSLNQKREFIPSLKLLIEMGYKIYATQGTADYYFTKNNQHNLNIKDQLYWIDWPFGEVGSKLTTNDEIDAIASYLSAKEFDLVINLPLRSAGSRRVSTLGYRTRRFAVDHSVPLISDIKCAKLLIEALYKFHGKQPIVDDLDCLTSYNIITLPGLIDIHVHAREPGGEHKEDFGTVTAAALAGGVTFVGVMPNTNPPIVDESSFRLEQKLAHSKAFCDYGLIVGATPTNAKLLALMAEKEPILALKMYMNPTTGTLCMSNPSDWEAHFANWPDCIPICVHAEGKTTAAAILFSQKYNKQIHICHVSSAEEILLIKHAKSLGVKLTCEVAPHHLLLSCDDYASKTQEDQRSSCVKPPLMKREDQDALWDNIDIIDCFATDHAPHLIAEKTGENPAYGFPGLETMLPLLLDIAVGSSDPQFVNENHKCRKLTIQQIVDMLYTNPKRIFNIPDQQDTSVEVDLSRNWRIGVDRPYFSRAQWSPFHGRQVRGKVIKVTLRGKVAFVDDKLYAESGNGHDLISDRNFSFLKDNYRKQQLAKAHATHQEQTDQAPPSSACAATAESGSDPSGVEPARVGGDIPISAPQSIQLSAPQVQFSTRIRGMHVTSIDMFDRSLLHSLFELAESYLKLDKRKKPIEPVLKGKVMATVFLENSTRTEWSFASAMMRLGGSEKKFEPSNSSTTKGETLDDTLRILAAYCHVIVLRHGQPGAVTRAAEQCNNWELNSLIVNGGDGTGEHPTQALLDVFTIRKELGTVSKMVITMAGDLKHGRTVHSLAKLLCNYDLGELRFVAPKGLEIPEYILEYLKERNVQYQYYDSLESVVKDSDVIYMTRIQRERFAESEYEKCCGKLRITPMLMTEAKSKMIVMHPLPRNDEIDTDFDEDSRAAYFSQAQYGLYVRMALLTMILA